MPRDSVYDDAEGAKAGPAAASDTTYNPSVLTDWDSNTDPGNVNDALDQLAGNAYSHPNHTGHVTSTGDGATVIGGAVVSNAMHAAINSQHIKGRQTAGAGIVEDLTAAKVRAIINTADGADVTGDNPPQAHTHDGDTLQHDGVNSNGGAFSFATSGTVTFTEAVQIALDKKACFGDTDVYIFSDDDGDLDIVADNDIVIAGSSLTTVGVLGTTTVGDNVLRQFEPANDVKVNLGRAGARFNEVWAGGGIRTQYSTDDVNHPPTDAQLDIAFGTPAAVGAGFMGIVNDNGGDANGDVFLCISTGTSWHTIASVKAV